MIAQQQRQEIVAEIELRKRDRNAWLRTKTERAEPAAGAVGTKYKDLYSTNTVKRKGAIREIA